MVDLDLVILMIKGQNLESTSSIYNLFYITVRFQNVFKFLISEFV